jgi:hypothetical protein
MLEKNRNPIGFPSARKGHVKLERIPSLAIFIVESE